MADWGGIIGTVLGGVTGLAENLFGTQWEEEANAREKALGPAPEFQTPQSQLEYEQLMASRADKNMPGYQDMLNQVEAQTAYRTAASGRVASSQAGALAGANTAQMNRRRQLRQLGIANDTYKSQAELDAIKAQASRAPYEQMAYEYNEWLPWQIAKNEIAALRGVGQSQIMGGLDQTAAAGIYTSQIFGNNQSSPQGNMNNNTPYVPYNYGAAGSQIQQMGQNQLDPYYSQTNNTEGWMKQPF